jgi:hypothetical protein
VDGQAQVLRGRHFQWLFDHHLWRLARELFGPRCDFADFRASFYQALSEDNRSLSGLDAAASDLIPASAQVHEWHQLLLSANIVVTYINGSIAFVGASDRDVLSASWGEVRKDETINHRTRKPEVGGLFCEATFGPQRSWQCRCGKYKGRQHANGRCERCGVELIPNAARRWRMGHVELVSPVVHPWRTASLPGVLGLSPDTVRKIIDYDLWLVADSNDPDVSAGTLLGHLDWLLIDHDRPELELRMELGAAAIETLLERLPDADRTAMDGVVMHRLPVLPPDLRPMVHLGSERYATSDLNHLYRGVLHRNSRLRRLIDHGAPLVIVNQARYQLQRSVDQLLDNERTESPVTAPDRRTLVSVTGALTRVSRRLTAREGFLFRPVDFSAHTRMIVGETPDLDTASLSTRFAERLFEPLLHRRRAARKNWSAVTDENQDDFADELVLVATGRGPWPLFAMRFRLTHDVALTVRPELLDLLGWEHLGEPVAVFAVLTDDARHEAERLLPSVLTATTGPEADHGDRALPFDLSVTELLQQLPDWIAQRRTFRCTPEDAFLVGGLSSSLADPVDDA